MNHAFRLARLHDMYTEHAPRIMKLATSNAVTNKHKQHIYSCLNNMCRISGTLFGELSAHHGNYDLLEKAAAIDAALLELRSYVGRNISMRMLATA